MTDDRSLTARRRALKCLAFGSAGTLFTLAGGVFTPLDLAQAAQQRDPLVGQPLFVQISDTHIGFNKEANPDVAGTLTQSVALVNALPRSPALIIHTGDITHLSRAAEFDQAQQLLGGLRVSELHTVPGEHDVTDPGGSEYFKRFGAPSDNRGYYSFDHGGVHFLALTNVLQFKPGGLGSLGEAQLAFVQQDLAARSASTPIVVFAHMPLWTVYEPWGWGTEEAAQLLSLLRRFGSVTVLNGHIHQIIQKVEGNVTFHTARSTAYPQPAPGVGSGPAPLQVGAGELPRMLGVTRVSLRQHGHALTVTDTPLAAQGV
jgi:3',5'-cyclic AMP phosphodiesterase CpdA